MSARITFNNINYKQAAKWADLEQIMSMYLAELCRFWTTNLVYHYQRFSRDTAA